MIKVYSPANIAFIKHWGISPSGLPLAPSLSMNLSNCTTTTTISENDTDIDTIELINFDGVSKNLVKNIDARDDKVFAQINLIRNLSKKKDFVKISSSNNFPTKSGIASSASGFSALTLALVKHFELEVDLQNLANLVAKAGSISAVRSLCDNFGQVELKKNGILAIDNCNEFLDLDLIDIVVVVNSKEKHTSSLAGQRVAETSPFFESRLIQVKRNFNEIKSLAKKNFWHKVGEIIEQEAIMLHSVMLTSSPSQMYINSASLAVIELIYKLRESGIEAYFTIDAGANVHIISKKLNQEVVCAELNNLDCVNNLIVNYPCTGTYVLSS